MFDNLCEHATQIQSRTDDTTPNIIRQSAEWHLRHITSGGDPFEALEARPLDFGHWSAHKLEAMSRFALRHGEAVAIGLAIDTVYSSMVHGLPKADSRRVLQCLEDLGFDLQISFLSDQNTLLAGLEEFRQHLGGRLTLTMLRGVGEPMDVHQIDRKAMQAAIHEVAVHADAERR